MLSAGWVAFAICCAVLLTVWVTFTVTRLDRLHARVDAAQSALDAQLVRRAAALKSLAETASPPIPRLLAAELAATAQEALIVTDPLRAGIENRVGKALSELTPWRRDLPAAAVTELAEAATRVVIARRFYNHAVRDTRTLRARRMPRLLHLAGGRDLPSYFDIDDTVLLDDTALLEDAARSDALTHAPFAQAPFADPAQPEAVSLAPEKPYLGDLHA